MRKRREDEDGGRGWSWPSERGGWEERGWELVPSLLLCHHQQLTHAHFVRFIAKEKVSGLLDSGWVISRCPDIIGTQF